MKWLKLSLAAMLLAFGANAHSALLTFTGGPAGAVTQGDVFNIDVSVSDLGGEIVSAYDFNVLFSGLDLLDVSFGDVLDDPANGVGDEIVGFDLFGPGDVNLFGLSFESDADLLAFQGGDAVTLLQMTFRATAPGQAELDFVPGLFPTIDIKGLLGFELDVDSEGTMIPVEPRQSVPEPGTIGMLLLGAGGLLLRRRAIG